MRAIRLDKNGQWRNRPIKDHGPRHPRYAAKNCPDCDSGVYCRCPIRNQLVDRITNGSSPYSRDGRPPSSNYVAFLNASKQVFDEANSGAPGTVPLPQGAQLLQSRPDDVLRSPYMPPMLGDAVLSAGIYAARRHTTREYMCGSPTPLMTTKAALRGMVGTGRPLTAQELGQDRLWQQTFPPTPRDPLHPGLKRPSPFRRCI